MIYDEVVHDLDCPTMELPVIAPRDDRPTVFEEKIMDALQNLTDEVAKLKDVLTSSVEPTLQQLIPADKVQEQADALSQLTSDLEASMNGAVAPASGDAPGVDVAPDAPAADTTTAVA